MKNLSKISIFLLIFIFTHSFGQLAKEDSVKANTIDNSTTRNVNNKVHSKQRTGTNRKVTSEQSQPVELKEINLYDRDKISYSYYFKKKARFNIGSKIVEICLGDSLPLGILTEDVIFDSLKVDGRYKSGIELKGKVIFINERAVYVDTFMRDKVVKFKPNTNSIFWDRNMMPEPEPENDITYKPIIYLYPEKETEVNVKLNYKGTFTATYPKYPENGWTVTAKPDGTLKDQSGKEYYSLFWEGVTDRTFTLDEGFIIKNEDAAAFLEKNLKTLGLNFKEANEFIIFWLPELEKHPYNLIHFSTKEYEELAKLTVAPVPDTLIRVFMVFKGLDKPIEVKPQTLVPKVRKGFTVVEWGGSEVTSSKSIKTK